MPKAKKSTPPTSPAGKVNAKLTLGDLAYTGSGASVMDALNAMAAQLSKVNPQIKGIIRVSDGNRSFERLVYPIQLKRLYANALSRQLFAKTITSGLK